MFKVIVLALVASVMTFCLGVSIGVASDYWPTWDLTQHALVTLLFSMCGYCIASFASLANSAYDHYQEQVRWARYDAEIDAELEAEAERYYQQLADHYDAEPKCACCGVPAYLCVVPEEFGPYSQDEKELESYEPTQQDLDEHYDDHRTLYATGVEVMRRPRVRPGFDFDRQDVSAPSDFKAIECIEIDWLCECFACQTKRAITEGLPY